VAWHDDRDGDDEVYFARLSSDGSKIGLDQRLTTYTFGSVYTSLSWTGSEFGVAWQDWRNIHSDIYFTRVSSSGAKVGSDLRVEEYPSDSHYPSLAWTGSEFGVSWHYSDEIYFTRVSSAGTGIGSFLRVTTDPSWSINPSLSWTGSEFGLSWEDYRDGNWEIYFARISSDGIQVGDDTRITFSASMSTKCSLAWTGSEFGVSWHDYRDGNVEIYFARIDPVIYTDKDGDGLAEDREYAELTDPCNPDTDGDGLLDGEEINDYGTDPLMADTDGDGINDNDEVNVYLTSATNWDTDGDLIPDLYEVLNTGQSPPLNPFDPSDGDTCFEQPSFEDINPNYQEYWNNTDRWNTDPVPPDLRNPACYFWGDADGDGFVANNDKLILGNAIIGLFTDYSVVIPDNGDSQDLDADSIVAGGDMTILQSFIINAPVELVISRAISLEKVWEPAAAVEVGSTTHVTVKVRADDSAINLYQGGFAVVFEIAPSSTGEAILLGGEGDELTGRYDVSGPSAPSDGGFATMHLKITGPGPIQINATIPSCGINGIGRWCDEVVLDPAFTITAVNP
jgi:hypothetical protein